MSQSAEKDAGLAVVNLYAYRATKPADLWRCADPVGRENDRTLEMFLSMAEHHDFPIIAAWGAHAKPERVDTVMSMFGAHRLEALKVTKAGAPGHPLYIRADAQPEPWPPMDRASRSVTRRSSPVTPTHAPPSTTTAPEATSTGTASTS